MVFSAPLKVVAGLVVAGLAVAAAIEWAVRSVDLPEGLHLSPPAVRLVRDGDGEVFYVQGHAGARDCRPVAIENMGDWLPGVSVGIEDARFFHHRGVDGLAVGRAVVVNMVSGRTVSGASTITQQLIKLMSQGSRPRTLRGKFYEALAAIRLERTWDKRKILETYLNRLDYGNRRIGPEAAAFAYFGKPASKLTLSEAIYLAGLPGSPTRRNPWINRAGADRHYVRNVRHLAARGLLPPGVDVRVLENAIPTVGRHDPPAHAPHYAAAALRAGVENTFLDPELQNALESLVDRHFGRVSGFREAAVVVLENATGRVRALAARGTGNPALRSRSAGSTLKPFLYARALEERRFTAASRLPDTPEAVADVYRDYAPRNFSRKYLGEVRLREALANSLNIPAVSVLSVLGARETFRGMRVWGLDFPGTFDDYGAGFVLGNAPVSPVALAGAYAALARGGRSWPVLWGEGQIVPEVHGVVSGATAQIIADILADPRARSLSFGLSSPLTLPWRAAVKTGTSSAFRDGWCAGFDFDHTVVVWVGNSDGRPLPGLLAADSAAPLWADVMSELHRRGSRPWPEMRQFPAAGTDLVQALVEDHCRGISKNFQEWFLRGTEPEARAVENGTAGRSLEILFPRDGQEFFFQQHLPRGRQVIVAESSGGQVSWTLNGAPCPGGRIPLLPGDFHLRAEDGATSADVRFSVKQNQGDDFDGPGFR